MDAHAVTLTPGNYQRFIAESAGEWSVAKNVYVAMKTGWFSCRTACYLAGGGRRWWRIRAGAKFIPAGNGLDGV